MLVTFDRDGQAVRARAEDAACIGSMLTLYEQWKLYHTRASYVIHLYAKKLV